MKRNTVSLCLIARNEEATIGMAIKSVLALVDEVIVADTGSTDNTRIIAEGYGARVLDVPWEDDFAATRNTTLNEATCDWILVLDADEILQPVRPVEFQRLLNDPGAAGFYVDIVSDRSTDDQTTDRQIRLFRNHPDVRYRYPIYEQVAQDLLRWAEPFGLGVHDCELVVMHEGSKSQRTTRNRERNHRILQKAVQAWPHEPYFPYRLACDSLMIAEGEVQPIAGVRGALGHLHAAWRKVERMPVESQRALDWLPDLGAKITSALLAVGRIEDARGISRRIRQLLPDNPVLMLQEVAASVAYLQDQAAEMPAETTAAQVAEARQTLDRLIGCLQDDPALVVDTGLKALYPLRYQGELALLEGHVSTAVGLFEKALTIDPGYSFGWLGMAECSRFAGDRKRALKLYLRTVTENEWNHRAWLRGSALMQEMNFHDNAVSWWRKIVTRFPEHPALRHGTEIEPEPDPPLSVAG